MSKPLNPPAFPKGLQEGMSLRDYFAGQALQGILSSFREFESVDGITDGAGKVSERVRIAYVHADAMLREREKR